MGGKTKQSQRTKNNARPSSSGRSAELLSGAKLEPGVVNIGGTQLPALFPSLAAPSVDPLLSPELQLCLKKLNKKDPITKTKALQELTELVTNSNVDDVVSALSSWCYFYKILTADPDRKVRECTQACHGALAGASGRRLAPHLRQLMPAWLQAQHDDHAPAQAHAQNSLAKTFPDAKLPEVLSFCKEAVVSHFLEVLIGSGLSAHIRKAESAEERAGVATRVATGALRGLQYVTRQLPAPHAAWLWRQLHPLLQASAFWGLQHNADLRIRAAWFGAIGSIISRFKGEFGAEYGERTLRVLVAGRESNPLPAGAETAPLWECLLLFMHHVPDWHKYLDNKESLRQRILDVLESGGWGDAKQRSNMLLPLLASLPDDILTKDFHIAFFDAIFSGLEKKSILSSKSERQYWITSLDECLRYLSTRSQPYVTEVVTSVHRTWLEKVLTDTEGQMRNHLIKYSAARMVNLVKYWLKQAREGNNEKYEQLIRNFWQNVGSTLTSQIDKLPLDRDDIDKLTDSHILLLRTLKSSFTQELKKQHSIKFEVDTQTAERNPPTEPHSTDPATADRYNHNLNEVVYKICGHYFEFASTKEISDPVISPLISLLVEFDSRDLFVGIARQFGCDSVFQLYDNVVRSWLTGDTMRCKAVVHVLFMLITHLSEHEQDATFDTFKQFPGGVVEWCMGLALSHPHCGAGPSAAATRRWLRGPLVADAVRTLCVRLVSAGDVSARALLAMCLNSDDNGESAVSAGAVQTALQQLSASLYAVETAETAALEARCGLAAQLAATLPPDAALLTALLSLTISLQPGDPRLSVVTWCEVREAWQDAVTSLPAPDKERFLRDAAVMLHKHLNLESCESRSREISHAVSVCAGLALAGAGQGAGLEAVGWLSRALLAPPRTPPLLVEAYAVRHLLLADNLWCPFEEDPVTRAIARDSLPELSKEELTAHVNKVLFRVAYLRSVCVLRPDDAPAAWAAPAAPAAPAAWAGALLASRYLEGDFLHSIYDYVVIRTLCEGYAFWPHYKLIEETENRLSALLDDIINETDAEVRRNISKTLSDLASEKGYIWAYCRKYFEMQTERIERGDREDKDSDDNDDVDSLSGKPGGRSEDGSQVENTNSQIAESNRKESKEEMQKSSEEESPPMITNLQDIITGPVLLHTIHYLQANARYSSSESERDGCKYCVMAGGVYLSLAQAPASLPPVLRDVTAGLRECSPDVIVNAYYAHNHTMLYEMDVSAASWLQVVSNATVCAFLSRHVTGAGWEAAAHHWDFTNITLCSLLSSVEMSKHNWGTAKVALLASAVLRLFCAVAGFVSGVPRAARRRQPAAHVAALPAEWRDIYAPDLHANLFSLLLFVLESSNGTIVSSTHGSVIAALMECTAHMRWESLSAARRGADYGLARLAAAAAAALRAPAPPAFKYLAHRLLELLLKPMVLADADQLAAWSQSAEEEAGEGQGQTGEGEGEGRPLRLTLLYYDDAFFHLQDLVETAVSHVRVCEEVCSMVPFSDAHSMSLGWLLLGDIVNQQCMLARGDLTHQYIQIYRDQKYTEPLLSTALRLIPQAVLAQAAVADSPLHHCTTDKYRDSFTALPLLDVYQWCGAEVVQRAACRALWWCVRGAGAAGARGWRGAAHHRHALLLDNVTRRYITPHVVKEEFALLHKKSSDIEDAEVTINWSVYEVSCVLTVDEKPIELCVSLARQHPLVLPRLSAAHSAAGNLNWILMYLGYQNGTILNALKMWTVSVNNKLERAPQCYICYCRLHHATGRLPGVHCHTCRNKFHNVCLRKWFQSSSKMTCPLCRANF